MLNTGKPDILSLSLIHVYLMGISAILVFSEMWGYEEELRIDDGTLLIMANLAG